MRALGDDVTRAPRDSPGVVAPPPFLLAAAFAAGLALCLLVTPLRIAPRNGAVMPRVAGGILVALGLMLSIAVVRCFHLAGTNVSPRRSTARLVTTGPYRFSRNPDYLGQALVYAGSSLVANTFWPLLLLPAVIMVVQRGVVEREERYLEQKFGDAYRRYKARVRRWI